MKSFIESGAENSGAEIFLDNLLFVRRITEAEYFGMFLQAKCSMQNDSIILVPIL